MKEARRPNLIKHCARPAAKGEDTMENYKNQIIAMLNTVTDAKTMRMLYEVVKAFLMNR